MNIKTVFLLAFASLTSVLAQSQIRFSETIQTSKIASPNENTLYFVDFWATWCGPCVYATEYLEVLQKQYPKNFYVVSLSEENPDKVERHLEKRPTDLAVAIDYYGETFNQNNIRVLPYGILLNAKGNILWKGSPTDFKAAQLEKFLKQYSKVASFDDVFKIESIEDNIVKDYIPKENFEIKELKNVEVETLQINFKNGFVQYKGSLSEILAKAIQVIDSQVSIKSNLNKYYQIFIKENEELLPNLLSALQIELSVSEMNGEALVVDNSKAKFWDANQIDWGKDTARYLIDDNQIQADNISFKEILFHLSKTLDLPIVTTNPVDESIEHDWIIHHRFFSLMQNDLVDNYGLNVSKQQASFKVYSVTKKTPK